MSDEPRPIVLEWSLSSGMVLTSLLDRSPAAPEQKPGNYLAQSRPYIPHGVTGWRYAGEFSWRSLTTLSRSWGLRKRTKEDVTIYYPEDDDLPAEE